MCESCTWERMPADMTNSRAGVNMGKTTYAEYLIELKSREDYDFIRREIPRQSRADADVRDNVPVHRRV